ncbi:MAG: (Na+)-NQR maturation NqrM [Gammaproteobacteria bacterium]|nr:(Na+)-NQR maturation NqrM [Gammaproteobacteria bacterium]
MILFLITFIVMLIFVAAMSIGVIAGRRAIQGSCGGAKNIEGLEHSCSCSEPCEKRNKQQQINNLDKV